MKIVIAEDESVPRHLLLSTLEELGHTVTTVCDGTAAWEVLRQTPHDIVMSDWSMPGLSGPELCKRIRLLDGFTYVFLVTAKNRPQNVLEGIMAGADDFISKPWSREVLTARLHAAERIIALERRLACKIVELEQALTEVKTLRGLIPICSYCKCIRDDADIWSEIETYVAKRSDAEFTHSICPACYEATVRPMLEEYKRTRLTG